MSSLLRAGQLPGITRGYHFATKYPTDGTADAPRTVGTLYDVESDQAVEEVLIDHGKHERPTTISGTAGGKIGIFNRERRTATVFQATPGRGAGVAACGNCVAAIAAGFLTDAIADVETDVELPGRYSINVTATVSDEMGNAGLVLRRVKQTWHKIPFEISHSRSAVIDGRFCMPVVSPLNDWILVKSYVGENPLHLELDDLLPVLEHYGLHTNIATARIAVIQTEQFNSPLVRFISTSRSNAPLTGLGLLMLAAIKEPNWLGPLTTGFQTRRGMIVRELPKPKIDSNGHHCVEFADLLVQLRKL